jgi:hypothetical protein
MNWQFSEIEFRQMMFNPAKVPDDTPILKVYKELVRHPIFKKSPGPGLNNDRVLRYILCMYDKYTPYRSKFPDVLKRKIEIAHDVGFLTIEGGIFEEPVEDFLKGKNRMVNQKIVEYIRMHRNFKYTFLVGIENSYYNIMLEVMRGNTKRIADLRDIQQELEATMIEMLNEDDNPYMREAVLRYIEEERLRLRPEDVAKKAREDEQVVDYKEVQ